MKVGTFASLVLVALLALGVFLLLGVLLRLGFVANMGPWSQALTISIIVAAIVGAAAVPLGITSDRWLGRLRDYLSSQGNADSTTAFCAPTWLRPVADAFTQALEQYHVREQQLSNQLREIEISHHVSEAERRQIEAVLHSLRDGVLVTNSFNEIVLANERTAEILGFDVQKAVHQPIDRMIENEALCRMIMDTRDSGNTRDVRHVEHSISSDPKHGEPEVAYDITLACVEDHKQSVGGVVTILHDLSREREVSQMKSDFVSKASHELRTPLASIRAYVEMLVDGEAEDEESRQEFYRIIQDETDRLGRLIDNMLNISRIEAGIVQIEREIVDIKQSIDRTVQTLDPHAREKGISLHTKPAAIDLCVEGDKDMLYQVVLNLVSNAVKYTPEGGRITISADSDNLTRSVVVTIADTGLGIPPDALPKLFDKFYRVENYKRIAKGTGLGLSLCKHIVETVHHGQIGVESKLGMGSRFWFSIPMRYAGSQAAA